MPLRYAVQQDRARRMLVAQLTTEHLLLRCAGQSVPLSSHNQLTDFSGYFGGAPLLVANGPGAPRLSIVARVGSRRDRNLGCGPCGRPPREPPPMWSPTLSGPTATRSSRGCSVDRKSTRLNSSHLGISYA